MKQKSLASIWIFVLYFSAYLPILLIEGGKDSIRKIPIFVFAALVCAKTSYKKKEWTVKIFFSQAKSFTSI